jgi:hypothetical protein
VWMHAAAVGASSAVAEKETTVSTPMMDRALAIKPNFDMAIAILGLRVLRSTATRFRVFSLRAVPGIFH